MSDARASPSNPYAPVASGSAPVPPDESVRILLSVSRSLALVFAILAGLLFLLFLGFTVLDVVFGRGPGDLVSAAYCLASSVVNFVLWRELPPLEQLAATRQYGVLREHLLVWAILGTVFFVVVGVLLLLAWVKAELLTSPRPS
jgi:hypothetical protein